MSPRTKNIIDKLINEYRYASKKVNEAREVTRPFLEPITKPVNDLMDATIPHSIGGLFDEGTGRVLNAIGTRLGVDPTALALIGMVASGGKGKGKFKLPNRLSKGDPIARSRTVNTAPSKTPNTKGKSGSYQVQDELGRTEIRSRPASKSSPSDKVPANPGDRKQLAEIAEQKINRRLDREASGKRTDSEVQDLLKGDQYAEAYGPAVKKFGAYPKDIADQRAFVDADGPIPFNSRKRGRPSASKSSPYLRQLREGIRKETGLQAVKDRLNQGRGPTTPKQSTSPLPVSAERSERVSAALRKQLEKKANSGTQSRTTAPRDPEKFEIIENLLPEEASRLRQAPSKPAESADFSRRSRKLPTESSRKPVRRDSRGRVIKDKKNDSSGPVQGRSVGQKGSPGISIEERRSGAKPYTQARTRNSPDSGRSTLKKPDNSSLGRTFDKSGELRGTTTKGKNSTGRSTKAQQQTRDTLKSRIDYLRGLPWSAERSKRIQRMQGLLKRMK